MMKRFLGILVLGLLWCNIGFTDEYLINSIKSTHKKIFTEDPYGVIFLIKELALASNIIEEVALPCYRTMLKKGKSQYDKNANCLKFRTLFGDDANEFRINAIKFKEIIEYAKKQAEEGFFKNMVQTDMDKFNEAIRKIIHNMKTATQTLLLKTDD